MTFWLTIALALLLQAPVAREGTRLPESPEGRLVGEYVDAFNAGGDEQMRGFLQKYVSPQSLERTPIDVRMNRFREMRQRLRSLALLKVTQAAKASVRIIARSGEGQIVEMTFNLEPASPPRLLGIMVEDVDDDALAEEAATPKSTDRELLAAVEQDLGQRVAKDEFSGVVLLAKGDEVLFEKAYGLADKTTRTPIRANTRFNLGSINKVFTNIAIHQLAAQGRLSLTDTIGKCLPDYPNAEARQKVTVKHLLSMTSGIGDFFGERYQAMPKEKLRSIPDYLPLFAHEPLEFEPGTNRRYSNGGYIVLGAIIERVSGQEYYAYVRENIYKPAGMTESDWYQKDSLPPNTAIGYTLESAGAGGGRISNYESLPLKGSSAGGGYSTARDLLSFAKALRTGKLSSPDFAPSQGVGVAGGAPGMNAILEMEPGGGFVIIVLANYDPPAAEKVGRKIRGWLPRR